MIDIEMIRFISKKSMKLKRF